MGGSILHHLVCCVGRFPWPSVTVIFGLRYSGRCVGESAHPTTSVIHGCHPRSLVAAFAWGTTSVVRGFTPRSPLGVLACQYSACTVLYFCPATRVVVAQKCHHAVWPTCLMSLMTGIVVAVDHC